MLGFLKKIGLALCLISSHAQAQEPVVSLRMLTDDAPILIGRYVSFWETGSEQPADEAILQGSFDARFTPSQQELPGRGFILGNVWLRLLIDNETDATQDIFLDSRYPLLDSITLFQKNIDGVFVAEEQGDSPVQRTGYADYRTAVFKVHVAPGRNVYYLKMATEGSSIIALYLSKAEVHHRFQLMDMAILAIFFGAMLTLFLYNSFLTVSFRSVTYLYYSLFLASMLILQVALQGLWPTMLPRHVSAWIQNTGFALSCCVTYFTASLTTMHFLNMREHMPKTRIFFVGFTWATVLLFVLAFFMSYSTHIKLLSGLILLSSVAVLCASAVAVGRGYRPAFSYSFAWLFMIVSNIFLYLNFEGIWHIPIVVQWGNLPGVVCEGILMSLALGDRVNYIRAKADRTIHELNEELQNHLKRVEAVVDERTETIRTIVDNVTSGFLIIDRAGSIASGFTRSCRILLGCEIKEGDHFIPLLNLRPSLEKKFRMALAQVFDDQMPLEVTLDQLPKHVYTHGKYLHIDAAGLRDKHGVLQQLLLTLTDATELRRRKLEAFRNRSLLKTLRDIEGFRQFVAYSYESVQKLRQLQESSDGIASRETYFILHTLKGNCLVFQLPEITRYLHRLEERSSIDQAAIDRLEEHFKKYLGRHASLLRTPWGPASHEKRVTDEQLRSLQDLAENRASGPLKAEIEHWIHDMSAKPVRSLLQSMINDARVVARKLNKEVEVRVVDRDARVHSDSEEALIDELIHIVRNAIVHGIEDDREAANKTRQGLITLDFRELDDGLAISCSDDGRGFDRKVWEGEWVNRGLPLDQDIQQIPLVELISKISRGGFSTEEKVSLFAGRGIGIEALFAAVERCQGTIDIISESGKGCRFDIFVPRPHSLRSVS